MFKAQVLGALPPMVVGLGKCDPLSSAWARASSTTGY